MVGAPRALVASVCIAGALATAACNADHAVSSPGRTAGQGTPSSPAVFRGTPDEHAAGIRACLEAAGYTVSDAAEGSGAALEMDITGHTEEEFFAQVDTCSAELGSLDLTVLPDEQMRASYDARVAENECLLANGWGGGEAKSWETFRDNWRAGIVWEPLAEALESADTVSLIEQINSECAQRSGEAW